MIRFVTEQAECEALWEQFSPRERAWDEWELMSAFHDEARYRFNFMVHETDGTVDGLIPLVEDTKDNSYELFGGCYADSREPWIAIVDFKECFDNLPNNTAFFDLRGSWVANVLKIFPEYEPNFVEQDMQYYLVPADFDYDFINHIHATFSKDKRKGFLRDIRKMVETYPLESLWSDDDETEAFIELNVKNFGEESDYANEEGKQEVRRVVRELRELGYLRTFAIRIDGIVQAVSLSALYNNNWVALYSSSNNDINNLGKHLTVETIQEACRLKVDEINYMTGMAWKAAWHMKKNPVERCANRPPFLIYQYPEPLTGFHSLPAFPKARLRLVHGPLVSFGKTSQTSPTPVI